MALKNKSLKKDARSCGKMVFNGGMFANISKDPLLFANSDELRKIQNRNKKIKNK